jgi:hypothetical protein
MLLERHECFQSRLPIFIIIPETFLDGTQLKGHLVADVSNGDCGGRMGAILLQLLN